MENRGEDAEEVGRRARLWTYWRKQCTQLGSQGLSEPTGRTYNWMCRDRAWEEPFWDDCHPKLE